MIKALLACLLFKLSHVQAQLFVNHSNPPTNHSDLCHNIWSQSARRTKNWTRHFKARPWRTMSGAATYSIDKSAMKTWKCSDSPWTLKAIFPSNPRHLPRECHSMALQWLAVPGPHEPNNDKKGPIQTVQLLQLKPLIEYILFGLRFHEPLVPTVPTCGPQSLSQFRCLNIRCTFFDSQSFVCVYFGSVFLLLPFTGVTWKIYPLAKPLETHKHFRRVTCSSPRGNKCIDDDDADDEGAVGRFVAFTPCSTVQQWHKTLTLFFFIRKI